MSRPRIVFVALLAIALGAIAALKLRPPGPSLEEARAAPFEAAADAEEAR